MSVKYNSMVLKIGQKYKERDEDRIIALLEDSDFNSEAAKRIS